MELSIQLCSYYQKKLCFAPRPADRNAILLKQAAPNSYDRILSLFYRKMSRTSTICNLYYHLLYEALRNNVAIITTIRVHFIASEPAWLRAWCAFSFCVYPIIGGQFLTNDISKVWIGRLGFALSTSRSLLTCCVPSFLHLPLLYFELWPGVNKVIQTLMY